LSQRFARRHDRDPRPATRERRDVAILAKRAKVYAAAKTANPRRWTGPTRNWTPIGDVVLNPIRDLSRTMPLASAAE
jgi:hypothetical protein